MTCMRYFVVIDVVICHRLMVYMWAVKCYPRLLCAHLITDNLQFLICSSQTVLFHVS